MNCEINKKLNICYFTKLATELPARLIIFILIKLKNGLGKFKHTGKIICFTLIFFLIGSIGGQSQSKAQDKGLRLTPAFYRLEARKSEVVKDKVEIEYINFSEASAEVRFLEFDPEFKSSKESTQFRQVSKMDISQESVKTIINFEIETLSLSDKTYFWGYQVLFTNIKSIGSINEQISVILPIILTVNSDEASENPKPRVNLVNTSKWYINPADSKVSVQIGNISEKLINFSGEVVFTDDKDEIFYTQKVSDGNDRLFPSQLVEASVSPDYSLLSKGMPFPYFGKIKVYYRGNVNNERHIQTPSIEYYLIPKEVIIAALCLVAVFCGSFWVLLRKKKSKHLK